MSILCSLNTWAFSCNAVYENGIYILQKGTLICRTTRVVVQGWVKDSLMRVTLQGTPETSVLQLGAL